MSELRTSSGSVGGDGVRSPSSELRRRLADMSPDKRLLLSKRLAADGKPLDIGQEPIAIVGMGCRFPGGASDPDAYWQMLVDGVDGVIEVPADRWPIDDYYDGDPEAPGKMAARSAGFINDVDKFDPAFFDIDPAEAIAMDPQQRLLMEVTWEALEHSGLSRAAIKAAGTGVFVGIISHDYAYISMRDEAAINAWTGTGSSHAVAAGRLSYWLDLRGPSMAIDTACSASLVAVHQACRSLLAGDCRVGLAGGVSLMLSPITSIAATKLSKSILAADGHCKTFDAAADGMVRGEGCGMVVLKRLSHALADGDRIVALIRGTAVNHDGRSAGLTAPNAAAQQEVMQSALKVAALDADAVTYLEAHGTGTALGDPIEAQALRKVYGAVNAATEGERCMLGSAKTNFGHLEGAAGIAGLIKAAMCVERGFVPPHLHFKTLSPVIDFNNTRFKIAVTGQPWLPAGRRYAGVSSFGWAGTNAHAILEQPPEPAAATSFAGKVAIPLSARTPGALSALRRRWVDYLQLARARSSSLYDIGWTAAARRTHHPFRQYVVGSSFDEVIAALSDQGATPTIRRRPQVIVFTGSEVSAPPPQWRGLVDDALLSADTIASADLGARDGAPYWARYWARFWETMGVRLAAVHGDGAAGPIAAQLATELGIALRAPVATDLALVIGADTPSFDALTVQATARAQVSDDPRGLFLDVLGQLYRAGVDVRFEHLRPVGRCVSLPGYPWQRQRYWIDPEPAASGFNSVEIATLLRADSSVREVTVTEQQGEQLVRVQPAWQNAPGPTSVLPNGLEVSYQSAVELEHFFEDIFDKRIYGKNGIRLTDGDCVFDVGGNIGLASLFFHFQARGIQLWTFEPAPPLFRLLKANLARHGADAKLLNCGVSSQAGTMPFTFYPQSSGMSSFYADDVEEREAMKAILLSRQRRGVAGMDALLAKQDEYLDQRFEAETFDCQLRPLSAVIDEYQVPCIDLLKIDVQKAELDVLQGIEPRHWPRIRQIVIEVHDIGDRLLQITELLQAHGFEVISEQDDSYEGSLLHNLYAVRPAKNDPLAQRRRIVRPLVPAKLDLGEGWPGALAQRLKQPAGSLRWLAQSWLGATRHQPIEEDSVTPRLHALTLSAIDAAHLEERAQSINLALCQRPGPRLDDVARALQRQPARALRKLLYAENAAAARAQLRELGAAASQLRHAHPQPRLGMLISGLGDQAPSMAEQLYRSEPIFRSWLDRAAELLRPSLDIDIRTVLYGAREAAKPKPKLDLRAMLGRGPAQPITDGNVASAAGNLHDIRVAHPLLFALGYALIQQWSAVGITPAALLGYSLGEYLAATVAGVFSFEDALGLVATRAQLVHQAPAGTMLAVNCAASLLADDLGDKVWLAAINGADLCVVGGEPQAVATLREQLSARQLATQSIASSHAFHTPMLLSAADALRGAVEAVSRRSPRTPIVSNVTGHWLTPEQATDPGYWAAHLYSTVEYAKGLDTMASRSTALLEIGPGRSMISLALQRAQQRDRPPPCAVASLPGVLDNQSDSQIMRASLATLWQHGLSVSWAATRMDQPIAWMDLAAAEAGSAARSAAERPLPRQAPSRWFYLPSFRRDAGAQLPEGAVVGTVVLFAGAELAAILASQLRQQGARVLCVQPTSEQHRSGSITDDCLLVRPSESADYDPLWRELAKAGAQQPITLIHAWSLLAPPRDVAAATEYGLVSLHALTHSLQTSALAAMATSARQMGDNAQAFSWLVVTQAAHDVVGDEQLLPEQTLAMAVARSLPQEYAAIHTRAVDVMPATSAQVVARQLIRELTRIDSPAVVAWRGGHRWLREFVPFEPIAAPLVLPERAVIVITGGLGRVGRLMGRHWARRGAHIVLTSRTGFPPPERWADIAAGTDRAQAAVARDLLTMQSHTSVEVCQADVSDETGMAALVAALLERHGGIFGVIHAAGVVGESSLLPIDSASAHQINQLLAAKIMGAEVVVKLALQHRIGWCALVSSVSSVLGGAGLCSYAAGNLYMDALAQLHRDAPHTRVTSYCWDLFSPEAIADGALGHDLTANAMDPADAMASLEASLLEGMPAHAVVSVTELTERMARTAGAVVRSGVVAAEPAAYVAPRNELEQLLAELWARIMKREQISVHDNFFELGGHSLLGAQIVAAVEQELGIVLSLRQLFEHPTVAELALALVLAMADEADDDELEDALSDIARPTLATSEAP